MHQRLLRYIVSLLSARSRFNGSGRRDRRHALLADFYRRSARRRP